MKIIISFFSFIGTVLLTTHLYGQQVLCSFETEADIKSVHASAGVKITQTPDYAALNAHSLQCMFPDKGGTVTIQKFAVPSWTSALGGKNNNVDALLMFVWSARTGTLEMFVEDSSATIVGEQFTLKAGANHLQLPFAKLSGLNTEKIKSIGIRTTQSSQLYLDYVALDEFQEVLRNNGRWDIVYSNKIESAHFPWGKSNLNEKIKTYSISPVFDGRGIIELSQRLAIDHRVTTIGRNSGENRWGFGDFYNRRNPGGRDGDHPYSLAFNYIADDLLSKDKFDVIIWPGLHPWETYPKYIREAVAERVKAGAGLVLLYPSGKDSADFGSLSPLQINSSHYYDSINKVNTRPGSLFRISDTSKWTPVKDHYITRGVEFNAFPFGSIGVIPFSSDESEVLLRTANNNPVLAVKNYGKGRVVALAYTEYGFLPQVKNPWGTGLNNAYWEYMWSLVARAVTWAAGKESKASIMKVEMNTSALEVSLEKISTGDSLTVSIEDDFGVVEHTAYFLLKSQQSKITIPLPSSLHQGKHFANFQLKGDQGVYDWYSQQFLTKRSAQIVSISTKLEEIPAGAQVQSAIKLFSKDPFSGSLVANLYDNYNRVVCKKEMKADFTGSMQYDVTLDSKNVLSHLGRVDVVLSEGHRQADRKAKEIFFLRPRRWDDYDVTMYHFGPNPAPGVWPTVDAQLRGMQVTTLAAYTMENSRHANYKVQAQTRISGVESPDNGPDLAWYDSIKNRYLDTRDKSTLVRKYGLNDSAFLHAIKRELYKMVPEWRKFSPSAYYIFEEPSVTRYDDALDLDFSTIALTAMRKWLQQVYPSLDVLNKQWGTSFSKWDEVVPDDSREAVERGNYSSWADHRSFMEKSWADLFKWVQDAVHEIDPGGLVQLSGTQASGAHNGYDYSQINKNVGQMNPYDIGNQLEYHHNFNPDLKISGQAGYGATGKGVLYDFYQHIFVNETGGAYVFWQQSALNPDLTYAQSGLDMKNGFTEMREKGIGKLVASYIPENENRIAIHYSYPSIHGAWIVDGKIRPGRSYGSTSQTLEQFRRNFDGWVKILADAGLGFDFIAYSGIENNDLARLGYKVLILPMSVALSDKEIIQIQNFVKAGGVVIADALPGVMDGHTEFRSVRGLGDVFGIDPHNYKRENLVTPKHETNLQLTRARYLAKEDEMPQLLFNKYGKGNAYLLNYFLDSYPEQKRKKNTDSSLHKFKTLLDREKIQPGIKLTRTDGKPVSGISKYPFNDKSGPTRLLGILPDKSLQPGEVNIELDKISHVYDIRNKRYLGQGKIFKVKLRETTPELFGLVQGVIEKLKVVAPNKRKLGEKNVISFQVTGKEGLNLNSVVTAEVFNPKGEKVAFYGDNAVIAKNAGMFGFQTALNDLPGNWRVILTEVISGIKEEVLINIQ